MVGWQRLFLSLTAAENSRSHAEDTDQKWMFRTNFWIEMSQRPTSEGQTDKVICWECIAGGEVLKQGTIYYVVEQQPLACGKK